MVSVILGSSRHAHVCYCSLLFFLLVSHHYWRLSITHTWVSRVYGWDLNATQLDFWLQAHKLREQRMPLDGSGFIQGMLTCTVRGSGDTLSIFVFTSMFSNAVSSTYWVNRVYSVDYVFHFVSETLANNQNQKTTSALVCLSKFPYFPSLSVAFSLKLKSWRQKKTGQKNSLDRDRDNWTGRGTFRKYYQNRIE